MSEILIIALINGAVTIVIALVACRAQVKAARIAAEAVMRAARLELLVRGRPENQVSPRPPVGD